LLIAIEGVDGSGKKTQTGLLLERLQRENRRARRITFPNYAGEAAGAVKMYLRGDFGAEPNDVNPYAASTFYAVDRYASYKTDWGRFYEGGGIVIADRYTMSNMIHQGAKITDAASRREYYDWLVDLEYVKIGLPEPDITVFLDLSMELRVRLIEKRGQSPESAPGTAPNAAAGDAPTAENYAAYAAAAAGDASTAGKNAVPVTAATGDARRRAPDIHESSREYLNRAHICAREAAALFGWNRVDAERGGTLRDAADIHQEIYNVISAFI